jgi:hypothetical protein
VSLIPSEARCMSMSVHNPRRNPPGLVVLVSKEVEIRDCAPSALLFGKCLQR